MSSWSLKRQLTILLIPLVLIFGFSIFVYAKYFHSSPTCFDKVKNGDETGVDCGGSCNMVCSSEALLPVVLWSKSFNVTGSVWNSVAFVQNPNINSSAKNVPYEFRLYNKKNLLITSRKGAIDIPKNKTFAVFEGGLNAGTNIVKSTEFKFGDSIAWSKDNTKESEVIVVNSPIENESIAPKIRGTISNLNPQLVGPTELVALIFDGRGNAIDASKTIVDPLSKGSSEPFVFTWPRPFPANNLCQEQLNIAFLIDQSIEPFPKNPPEPFATIKNETENFVKNLSSNDMVVITMFGNSAQTFSDLSSNKDKVLNEIENISFSTSSKPNFGEGLQVALGELTSARAQGDNKKVIILITDGFPVLPQKNGESNYPTLFALAVASTSRSLGIEIYSITLNSSLNSDILSDISDSQTKVLSAENISDLPFVYKKIKDSICPIKPNVIEILSRPL